MVTGVQTCALPIYSASLDILRLGKDYEITTDGIERGAIVRHDGNELAFDAFVDATGQASLSVRDLPFPTLIEQGVMKRAATPEASPVLSAETDEIYARTGGIDLDAAFRPKFEENLCNQLYCAAISFLLHKMPFVQGITSSHEIGGIVSKAIIEHIETLDGGVLLKTDQTLMAVS